MQKIQILFPDPLMSKLREFAEAQDLPVSEVVRRASEFWLDRCILPPKTKKAVPVFDGGDILVKAKNLRESIYNK